MFTSCVGSNEKGRALTEVGGGTFLALLNTEIRFWRASISWTGTFVFELRCDTPEGFMQLMQRGQLDREARFLQVNNQCPCDLIHFSHLLAHAVLNWITVHVQLYHVGRRCYYKLTYNYPRIG